ncbi:MAG: mannonate dehydratase [Candidatus Cyclobacteriaceae bacterium M3_2C_046]
MNFIRTWRWFGPEDPVQLKDLAQLQIDGVVTSLLQFPVGETWPMAAIAERKSLLSQYGLNWLVVESLNVHPSIKFNEPDRADYIQKYQQTIRHLAWAGVRIICYNFMPVLDWVRTHYFFELPDGRQTIRFDIPSLAAFDLFALKRNAAADDYSDQIKLEAENIWQNLEEDQKDTLKQTIMGKLPGTDQVFKLAEFDQALQKYQQVGPDQLRENLYYFLQQVIPVAEAEGVHLAIHPDDPPFPVLGLPRIVSTHQDLVEIKNMMDSPANGFTFCSGSLGARYDNDLAQIIRDTAERIHFLHLRNVHRLSQGSFTEADHLKGDIDMTQIIKLLVQEQEKRKILGRIDVNIPMRPDHGFRMLDDFQRNTYPGYSLIGRLKALAQLEGLEKGIRNSINYKPLV